MKGKIDDQIALSQRLLEVIADIDLAGDFVTRFRGGFRDSIPYGPYSRLYRYKGSFQAVGTALIDFRLS